MQKESRVNADAVLASTEVESWRQTLIQLLSGERAAEVHGFLSSAIQLYRRIEEATLTGQAVASLTGEDAQRIKAIWVLSSTGTYFQARKEELSPLYRNQQWTYWFDRVRINHAFSVGRRIAELIEGSSLGRDSNQAHRVITENGPYIIYNGNEAERGALAMASKTPWLRIPTGTAYPREKIFIIHTPIDKTLDQVRSVRLPPGVRLESGDQLGIVAHVPQILRLLYMMEAYRDRFPDGMSSRVFPLPTPASAVPLYPIQELRGMLYYRFIANPPQLADKPYPFVL